MASASELSLALSGAEDDADGDGVVRHVDGGVAGDGGSASGAGAGGAGEKEEGDDEVKLLRLRTKRHEIVVVPDRKFLLCVVHDAHHGGVGAGGSAGAAGGRR